MIESGWYPPEASTPEQRLRYYARQFGLVEVDATYYALPAEQTAVAWAARTPAAFTFNIKAFSLFTQHPTRVAALPADLRADAEKTGKDRVYLKDVDPVIVDQAWERFTAAQRVAPRQVCVEFRNRTWMTPDNQQETLGFLSDHQVPYVCVDMPQGHRDSIPPVLAATAPLAVVRLHGHSDKWESKDIHERFGYRYTQQELAGWAPKIAALARDADDTQVLFNNCYRDYAQVNAEQLADLLKARREEAQ